MLHRIGADDAAVIETLGGIYRRDSDAALLASVLAGSPFHLASLYYDRGSSVKFDQRRRFLLAGDVCAAAASLIEDMERAAAVTAAYGDVFSPEQRAAMALLLPDSCKGTSHAPEAQRMRRRIGRIAEMRG